MKRYWLILGLIIYGCAQQPPPQPIVFTQPSAPEIKPPPPPPPADPRVGLPQDVLDAIANPQHPIVKHGIARIYPYDQYAQYKLTFAPAYVTQIWLNSDEHFEQGTGGDTTRWSVTGMDHTVTIKVLGDASDPKMNTNINISTDKRTYQIMARLGKFIPVVAWYYPDDFNTAMRTYEAATHDSKPATAGSRVASAQP